jgi:hypothetical protein
VAAGKAARPAAPAFSATEEFADTKEQTRPRAGVAHDPPPGKPSGAGATADEQEYCDIPAHASFALPRSTTCYTGLNRGRSAESARSLLTEVFRPDRPGRSYPTAPTRPIAYSELDISGHEGRYSTVTGR